MKKKLILFILVITIIIATIIFNFQHNIFKNNIYDQTISPKHSYNTYYISIPSKIKLNPEKETTKFDIALIPTKSYKLSDWQKLDVDVSINPQESSRVKEYYFVYNKKNYKKTFTINFNKKSITSSSKKLNQKFYTYLEKRDQKLSYDTISFHINEKQSKI